MTRAVWNGEVLAESERTVVVEGKHYFPPEDIKPELFAESAHTSICGWKGKASYYDIAVNGETNSNAAWFYPAPREAAAEIAGYIAFWRGVQVEG